MTSILTSILESLLIRKSWSCSGRMEQARRHLSVCWLGDCDQTMVQVGFSQFGNHSLKIIANKNYSVQSTAAFHSAILKIISLWSIVVMKKDSAFYASKIESNKPSWHHEDDQSMLIKMLSCQPPGPNFMALFTAEFYAYDHDSPLMCKRRISALAL